MPQRGQQSVSIVGVARVYITYTLARVSGVMPVLSFLQGLSYKKGAAGHVRGSEMSHARDAAVRGVLRGLAAAMMQRLLLPVIGSRGCREGASPVRGRVTVTVPVDRGVSRSRRRFASLAWLLLAGSVALGGVDEKLRRCAAIDDDTQRLQCYDTLARDLPVLEPGERERTWESSTTADGSLVELSMAADREVTGRDRTFRPLLVLSCRDGTLEAFVRTGMVAQQEHDEEKTVMLQLGDDQPFIEKMTEAEQGLALRFSSPRMVATQLLRYPSLLFQFMPEYSSRASVRFETSGLAGAIEPLLEACGLKIAEDGFVDPR